MSKQLFINNATAVPAADAGDVNPADVASARIAAFNTDDFASGTLNLAAAFSGDHVQFVQGGETENDAIISPIINMEDVVDVTEKAYEAPTAQVTTITPATGTGTATVRVVQTNTGFQPNERISVDVELDGKTATQIVDDFVAQLNKQYPDFLTAANNTDELELTGDIGVSFETALDNQAADWAISVTAPNFGSGTAEHIANLEEIAYGGNYTNRIYLPIKPPSYAADSTYDIFTVRVKTNTTSNIGGPGQKYMELIFAVQATATGIDLPTFFGV